MDHKQALVNCPIHHKTLAVYTYFLPDPDAPGETIPLCNGCEQCSNHPTCHRCLERVTNFYANNESCPSHPLEV